MGWLDELNASEECYMARTDHPPLPPVPAGELDDAWRCSECGLFVFNTDGNGHPLPGAPQPSRFYNEVTGIAEWLCSLCEGTKNNEGLNSPYWKKLHEKWVEREKKRRENNSRLTGDKDYFTGA
jgi:hypothetical protein